MPNLISLDHINAQMNEKSIGPLASRFDWRDQGKVTYVQNQGACGSCYAFASLASFESQLLIKGAGTFDFSENNLAECNYEETGCNGGNMWLSANYMATKGVVSESCDPYNQANENCKTTCTPLKNVTDMWVLYGHSIPPTNSLKTWLQTYGPLYVTINSGSRDPNTAWQHEFDNYNGSYTLYYPSSNTSLTDHAVLLVGWDDSLTHAGGTGGWIVKNSWGTNWGDDGYFYIAYGSAEFGCDAAFIQNWQDYSASSSLLYRDEAGGFKSAFGWQGSATAYGMVKLTPTKAECAKAVEIWTMDATSGITVEIYDSFNGSSLSDKLWEASNISFQFPGYHSIPIPQSLSLAAGNDVFVKVKFADVSYQYPIPFDNLGPTTSGCSYVSLTGANGTWTDLATTQYPGDIGIRLRTGPCSTTNTPTPTLTRTRTATPTATRTPTKTPTGPTSTPPVKTPKAWLPLLLKAQPTPVKTPTATTAPTVTPTPRSLKPNDGYWEGAGGAINFLVTNSGAYVDDFTVVVNVTNCGVWEITHTRAEPITNGSFSFSGAFYASGTFSSATRCSGTAGLVDFNIPECGPVSGGPWSYTATWQGANMTITLDAPAEEVVAQPLPESSKVEQPFQAQRARARE